MKIAALVLTTILLLALCFILFASNRVLILRDPPMPTLTPQGVLRTVTTTNGIVKLTSLDGTTEGKICTIKLTALPLSWGEVVPTTSAQVKKSVEDDHRELKRLFGAHMDDLTNAREFSFNEKPGCVFVLSKTGNRPRYGKVLDFVYRSAHYQLSSSVKGDRISARDKAQADARFKHYLAELRKAIQ